MPKVATFIKFVPMVKVATLFLKVATLLHFLKTVATLLLWMLLQMLLYKNVAMNIVKNVATNIARNVATANAVATFSKMLLQFFVPTSKF